MTHDDGSHRATAVVSALLRTATVPPPLPPPGRVVGRIQVQVPLESLFDSDCDRL
jgi:hypothetical protein